MGNRKLLKSCSPSYTSSTHAIRISLSWQLKYDPNLESSPSQMIELLFDSFR